MGTGIYKDSLIRMERAFVSESLYEVRTELSRSYPTWLLHWYLPSRVPWIRQQIWSHRHLRREYLIVVSNRAECNNHLITINRTRVVPHPWLIPEEIPRPPPTLHPMTLRHVYNVVLNEIQNCSLLYNMNIVTNILITLFNTELWSVISTRWSNYSILKRIRK